MIPLGPLNGKNFGTTVSPWIITLDALQPFIVENQKPQVAIPGHLQDPEHATYAIRMQVEILAQGVASTVGASQIQSLYWSARQMIAHVASAGSPLNTGDVMATGTVSGSQPGSFGCLLEVTEGGKIPFKLQDGTERRFLQDGDVVRMTAVAGDDESGVGFGECIGKLLPSLPFK
jgi:fumarylacetoacetase